MYFEIAIVFLGVLSVNQISFVKEGLLLMPLHTKLYVVYCFFMVKYATIYFRLEKNPQNAQYYFFSSHCKWQRDYCNFVNRIFLYYQYTLECY